MEQQTDLGIGQLSRRTGCSIETIRYYERIGLLPKPRRGRSRYRLYAADDVQRVSFIRRSRELGFTLSEIRVLLRIARDPGACSAVRDVATAHLADLRAKIADLKAMERALAISIGRCRGAQVGCPIVDALSG